MPADAKTQSPTGFPITYNPTTAHFLHLMSILAPEPLPVTSSRPPAELPDAAFGVRLGDIAQTAEIIRGLTRSGLVKRLDHSLQMHRLVQVIIARRLSPESISELVEEAALLLAASTPGNAAHPSNWSRFAALMPHVDAIVSREPNISTWNDYSAFAELILASVSYYYRSGRYQKGLEFAQFCLTQWQAQLGEAALLTLRLKNNLGTCMTGLEDYSGATQLYRELYAEYTATLGPFANRTLRAAHNIGVTLNGSKKFDEAVEILRPVLERFREVAGRTDPETLRTADSLAAALTGIGAYEESVELATENLALRKQVLPSEHPDLLESAYTLGVALSYGDPGRARIILEETLALQERVLGPEHSDTERTASVLRRLVLL